MGGQAFFFLLIAGLFTVIDLNGHLAGVLAVRTQYIGSGHLVINRHRLDLQREFGGQNALGQFFRVGVHIPPAILVLLSGQVARYLKAASVVEGIGYFVTIRHLVAVLQLDIHPRPVGFFVVNLRCAAHTHSQLYGFFGVLNNRFSAASGILRFRASGVFVCRSFPFLIRLRGSYIIHRMQFFGFYGHIPGHTDGGAVGNNSAVFSIKHGDRHAARHADVTCARARNSLGINDVPCSLGRCRFQRKVKPVAHGAQRFVGHGNISFYRRFAQRLRNPGLCFLYIDIGQFAQQVRDFLKHVCLDFFQLFGIDILIQSRFIHEFSDELFRLLTEKLAQSLLFILLFRRFCDIRLCGHIQDSGFDFAIADLSDVLQIDDIHRSTNADAHIGISTAGVSLGFGGHNVHG